jgi:type IV secretion system protein VirB10
MNSAPHEEKHSASVDSALASNPYARAAAPTAPDLDAVAPLLQSGEMQRLNRKALAFLAAIVALLVVSAAWMFAGASTGGNLPRRHEETVVIPELPHASAEAPALQAAPIPLVSAPSSETATDVPPLPLAPPPRMATPVALATATPPSPSLLERREGEQMAGAAAPASPDAYAQALLAGMPPSPVGGPGAAAAQAPAPAVTDATGAQYINHPDTLLVRGSYIRCVLETRIVTDISGFTSCVVTEPVYSINGRNQLLAKGSKVSGRYDTDANGPRVAVVWDRITTPDGFDIRMASPGVDNLGGAGHPGDYDAHWGARMSSALMISLVSDLFKYEGELHGPDTTTISNGVVTQAPFDSNTARTMERLANQALDRSVNRPATVTINQGSVVNIYVARDVDFASVIERR